MPNDACASPRTFWTRFRPAFTLIELLVVIAIIAILAALLLPKSKVSGIGAGGFFSFGMNIDLKRVDTPPYTTAMPYPQMPKMTSFRNPSAVVCLYDEVFNPVTEVVNGSPSYNSVNPANRQNSFAARHEKGGVINFFDGHAAYFKTERIQKNPSTGGEKEPLLPDVIWDVPYRQSLN